MNISNEIFINKPFTQVWDFLKDPANTAKWQEGFTNWELVSGKKGEPGSVAEWTYDTGVRVVKVTETIKEVRPGYYEGVFKHDALKVNMVLTMKDSENQTHLRSNLDIEFSSPSMDVTAPFMHKIFNSRQESDLLNLKKVLEG